jgi:hypothetical protein
MIERPPPKLDPALAQLLTSERAAQPRQEALDRVWSHVERTLVPIGSNGGGSKPLGVAARLAARQWAASHIGGVVAVTFVVGGATGMGAAALVRTPGDRIVYVERPAAAYAPSASVSPLNEVAPAHVSAPAVVEPTGATPRTSAPRAGPVAPASSSLLDERMVLDKARTALAQNDSASALALTDAHVRKFAHPQLREEREAIAIQAMVLEGRYDEARERGSRFRAATPDSLFLPAVEASLASIP